MHRSAQHKLHKPLNEYFDHTILKPESSEADVRKLCAEAKKYGFFAVCVNSRHVELAAAELTGSGVRVAATAGFPLGACAAPVKAFEAGFAVSGGADEIDMVLAVGALKEKRYDYVRRDIEAVVEAAEGGSRRGSGSGPGRRASVKVILETCMLTDGEIVEACRLAEEAGAAFVKTSTGFSTAGASVRHVALMKKTVGDRLQVKASGGIRDLETALAMIGAGADRVGASASAAIMDEYARRRRGG